MDYKIITNDTVIILDVNLLIELLETMIEEIFGYHPLLQEWEEDGELEVFVHSESYNLLTEDEIKKLQQSGITDDNCINEICDLLNISIMPIPEKKVMM